MYIPYTTTSVRTESVSKNLQRIKSLPHSCSYFVNGILPPPHVSLCRTVVPRYLRLQIITSSKPTYNRLKILNLAHINSSATEDLLIRVKDIFLTELRCVLRSIYNILNFKLKCIFEMVTIMLLNKTYNILS